LLCQWQGRPPGLPARLRRKPPGGKLVRPSPDTNDESTRGPSWKKARCKEYDEEESRDQPDYASNHKEVDGDFDEESRNQPDYASNHKEMDGDVGSRAAWDEALEEAVRLHNSTPRRVQGDHSEAHSSQSEAADQEMSVTREGCIETLDCTSMRRAPEVGHDQKKPPSETSSVSRYIKEEEDEIDYPTAALGTASQGTSRGPMLSTISIQDQVVSVYEEPLRLTKLSPTDDRFARRSLLDTTVTVDGQDVVALLDSGCEAKLVLS
jgi:hypothetical protein